MTTRLRIDPWDPEYGGSWETAAEPDEDGSEVRLDVEDLPWEPLSGEEPDGTPRCAFIDGVRRIDVRLFAEADDRVAPGLAGSWAVGMAVVGRPPAIESVRVGRELVVGGGLDHPDLVGEIGASRLRYRYRAVDGTGPLDPLRGLQNSMRDAEADLAGEVLAAGRADLLVLDGPLSYPAAARRGPVVGLVKRQSRAYLPAERATLLGRLERGQRTPLFRIGGQRLERYSWYARVGDGRRIDGVMTGIVRLEVAVDVGLASARELADRTTALLPRFATAVGRDPRAPQNLYPVARLESVLHHRLGDPGLVRRALEAVLWRGVA